MNDSDPVLSRLGELPVPELAAALSARIRDLAETKLVARPLARGWTLAVGLTVALYLAWALAFTSSLVASR